MPITPDTKDWTWVLERPCAECGFDASIIRHGDIPDLILHSAADWRALMARPEPVLRKRPRDDMWSALEYACHVRDVYRIGNYRVCLMLDEDDPVFPNWDQDASAEDDRYSDQQPDTVLDELAVAASDLAARLSRVVDDEWLRPGQRSDGARFSVGSFAKYVVHDPMHHVYDVEQGYTAMGISS